jgi:hypothetical protein
MPTLPYDGGIANTPTGDSDRLDDVVANTKSIADNQALQGSALKDIGDKITGQTAAQVGLLGEISDKLEGLGGGDSGPSAGEIGSAVGDAVQDVLDDQAITDTGDIGAMTDSAYELASEAFGTDDLTLDGAPEAYKTKKTIESVLDTDTDYQSKKQAIKDKIESVELEASGNCSTTVTLYGRPVEIGICQWAASLQTWGVIVNAIAGLYAFMIIFKR